MTQPDRLGLHEWWELMNRSCLLWTLINEWHSLLHNETISGHQEFGPTSRVISKGSERDSKVKNIHNPTPGPYKIVRGSTKSTSLSKPFVTKSDNRHVVLGKNTPKNEQF